MALSHSKSLLLNAFGLATLLLLAGCGGLDSVARQDLERAEEQLNTQPVAALATFERLSAEHPDDPRIRRGQALAREAVGDHRGAMETWLSLLAEHDDPDGEDAVPLHRGVGRCALTVLGPLPASYMEPDGDTAELLRTAIGSFGAVLEIDPADPAARYGVAYGQHRIGRHAEAKRLVDAILATQPGNAPVRLLELRIRQELIGLSPAWVRELATLLTGSDDAVRDETARLFVSIAAQEKLDPRVKFEIDSTLSRIRTMSQLPEGLLARLDRYEEEERQKLSRKEAAQLVERAGHARDRGDWREGWQLLDRAVQIDASLAEVRSAYVCDWAAELAGQLRRDLTQDRIAFAEGTRRVLATLPRDHFSPELLAQLDELEEDYQEAWSRHGIKVSMDRANSMLNSDQNEEALAILDEVQGRVSEGRRVQFDVLYAKTLAACGRIDEAIEILDRLDRVGALVRYRDTVVFRDYGILLSLAGRSEEAQKILEELPLNLFDSQAFHALVVALEKQGEWESVIARLQGLSTMPDKYRPIWVHCAAQAAKRRLRSGDAAAAKLLLESYLDKKDYENPEVKEVYVQVLVETDQLDEACEIILTADEDLLSFMPTKLMNMVRDRAVNELSDEQRFDLYVRLLQHAQDPELTETVDELWPRFGSYFPTPGDYAIKYQVRTLNPSGSTRDIETIDLELAWTEGHFDVKTPTGPETWRIEDGVWYRSTAGVEMRIPCRASAKPPYPVEQFRDAGQLWSAQIVEAGVPVEVKGRSFENCLKIHVINEGNQNSFRFVYLAPKIGVVLREEHRFGEITKVWEFSEIQLR